MPFTDYKILKFIIKEDFNNLEKFKVEDIRTLSDIIFLNIYLGEIIDWSQWYFNLFGVILCLEVRESCSLFIHIYSCVVS